MAPPAGGEAAGGDSSSARILLAVHAVVRPQRAGPGAEAPLRRLQLSTDPERPGRLRLQLQGSGPEAVSERSPKFGPSANPLRALEQLLFLLILNYKMGIMLISACKWPIDVTTSSFGHHKIQSRRPLSLDSSPPQVNLEWPLESVSYTICSPSQHELQPPPGGPGTLSLHFLNSEEAQRWAALVQGASAEGQNGQFLNYGSVGVALAAQIGVEQ